jgi:hypothetical protein
LLSSFKACFVQILYRQKSNMVEQLFTSMDSAMEIAASDSFPSRRFHMGTTRQLTKNGMARLPLADNVLTLPALEVGIHH